jgi:hypothetical protein
MLRLGALLKRFYFHPRDFGMNQHDVMIWMVPNFINCRQSLDFLKTNEGQIPPKVIGDMLASMANLQIPLDEHWPEICKHVKSIIEEYPRNFKSDLVRVARHVADLGEANAEFWELIEKKLMTEGLVRYLSEAEAAQLLWGLCKVNRGSDALWKRLENEVARYYVSMENDDLGEAIFALEVSGKGDRAVIQKLKSRLQANELALLT